jgi:hypothetical protein
MEIKPINVAASAGSFGLFRSRTLLPSIFVSSSDSSGYVVATTRGDLPARLANVKRQRVLSGGMWISLFKTEPKSADGANVHIAIF